jgi:hypothetical protein
MRSGQRQVMGIALLLSVMGATAEPLPSVAISNRSLFSMGVFAGIHVWSDQKIEGIASDNLRWILSRSLSEISKTFPLKNLLEKEPWGLILDSKWQHSSALWSENLRDPDGHPAVLMRPEALRVEWQTSRLLLHEYFHAWHFQNRPREESWIREGLAMLAEYRFSHFRHSLEEKGLEYPEISLTLPVQNAMADESFRQSQYGQLALFFTYLYERCGKESIFQAMTQSTSSQTGVKFLRELFAQKPLKGCESFDGLFTQFSIDRFEGRVLPGNQHSPVREERLALEPFSASAYRKSRDCEEGETESASRNFCIQIRLD